MVGGVAAAVVSVAVPPVGAAAAIAYFVAKAISKYEDKLEKKEEDEKNIQ